MDIWIGVLAFVLFLGFGTADAVCINALKRQSDIVIKSRIKHRVNGSDVIIANLSLIVFGILIYFHLYTFVPAILAFVLFIVLSSQVNVIILKIRANGRQYILVCDRTDRAVIKAALDRNYVNPTRVIKTD